MEVHAIGVDDFELICRHRELMFQEAGFAAETLSVMSSHFRTWLLPRLADRSYFGFLLINAGRPVAGIGLMLIEWPPHPAHPTQDQRGYVLNVYVDPAFRRQGLAQRLMTMGEAEFARRGVGFAVLHATEAGRPLYQQNGWNQTSEMSKMIAAPAP